MFNLKIFLISILGLVCLFLAFLVHWSFIIGAVILMLLNQKELFRKIKPS